MTRFAVLFYRPRFAQRVGVRPHGRHAPEARRTGSVAGGSMTVFVSTSRTHANEDAAIVASLTRFQRGDDRVPRGVRPVIEESWQRSLRGGVDPVMPRPPRSV